MSPSAADVLGTSAVEPHAAVTPPSAKRATAGFQEHLKRAGQAAQSPLLDGHESPARSARHESSRTGPADDRDRGPRDHAAPSAPAPKGRRPETQETDTSGPTAEADRPATTAEEASADDATNSPAEQAAGQAGAADASAKPADQAPKEEAVAVVEAVLTAELTEQTDPQMPASAIKHPPATVVVGAAVDEVAVAEEETAPTPETAKVADKTPVAASPAEIALAEQAATKAAQNAPQADASAPAEQPVEATAAVAKTAKPEVAADTDDEKTDRKQGDDKESAVADAKPAGATTTVAVTAVDPTPSFRDTDSKDEKPKSDDKPTEFGAKSNDPRPGGGETSRIDAPLRTPAPADPTARRPAAASGEGTTNLSQVERTRLVQRVAKAVQTAHDRGGELKLRLSPPELGSIKLEIRLHEGVMSARIETETREAQQVLNENLLVLRERLAEQNIKVERFDVDVFNPGAGGGGNAADLRQQNGDGRGESDGRGGSGSRESVARGEPRTSDLRRPAVSTDGRINVVI